MNQHNHKELDCSDFTHEQVKRILAWHEAAIAVREREARIVEARVYIAFPGLTPETRLKALLDDSPVAECGINELKKGEA